MTPVVMQALYHMFQNCIYIVEIMEMIKYLVTIVMAEERDPEEVSEAVSRVLLLRE